MTMGGPAPGAAPAPGRRKASRADRPRSDRSRAPGARSSQPPGRNREKARDKTSDKASDSPRSKKPPTGPKKGRVGLRAPGVPRPAWRSRGWRIAIGILAVALLGGWLVWYATTPEDLPVSDRTVNASGVVGTPVYVGMFTAPDDFGRTLRVSGVKVHTTATAEMTVTPLLCRRGAVGVTTSPEQFCRVLVDPEGQRVVSGDSIVLKVEAGAPALAVIDRIRIAYRDDIRWDTQPAGHHQAIVSIAGRPEAE